MGRVSEPTVPSQAAEEGKRVSWAELFFDLVFVVAVTRVSALIEDELSLAGMARALVVFVPVFWLWVGTTIQANLRDLSRPVVRLQMFAIALAAVFMALALPDAYGQLGLLFALAYWAGRVVLGFGMMGLGAQWRQWHANPVTVSIAITGPLLVIGALVHGDARIAVWTVAAVIDLSTPTVLRSRLVGMHYDAGHLSERFGTFVLIALGESVVAVVTSADPDELTVMQGFAVAAAFAVSVGLWWVYFQFAADAVRHALATARVQLDITRLVLSYGHLIFIAAIIAVAVGLRDAVAAPDHHLTWTVTALLFGGCALYLAGFGFTRWAMFHLVSRTRLGAAGVVLVLCPIAPHVPALASLFLLAAVLAVLNTVEWLINAREGWRARADLVAGRLRRRSR
jgi:low temperature requirement protein LtrA